ncbi:hypothetical protein [Bacillus sp. JJ1562]|uniref:hypothetical protein n=1 Tax=Bacillus sp. JJ1562 TaxID=3122960 RepID=UPI003002AC11
MNKDEQEFEKYFRRKLHDEHELIKNSDYTEEQLREIFLQEWEWNRNAPELNIKFEPQLLDYETTKYYLPEGAWEMPRKGKLLYSDEELQKVIKLISFNLGARKSLDVIPRDLIEKYLMIVEEEDKSHKEMHKKNISDQALRLNSARSEGKVDVIRKNFKNKPEWSVNEIAKTLEIDVDLVIKIKKECEFRSKVQVPELYDTIESIVKADSEIKKWIEEE